MAQVVEIDPKNNTGTIPEEVQLLRKQHPLYTENYELWQFYLAAYEGGTKFANSDNLFRHAREHEEDYEDRVERLHNLNYCETLVDHFTNFIFTEPIDRSGGKATDFFLKFIEDVNRRGDDVDDFMREVSDDMHIFGMSYVLVDAPRVDGEVLVTRQDELDGNVGPYWVLVKPLEVIDWIVDDFGKFIYVKRRQYVEEFVRGERKKLERYTEWTPSTITLTDVDITTVLHPEVISIQVLENKVKKIPLVPIRFKRSKSDSFLGLSFLRDFAFNQREIMNLTSLLQEFLYRQAFNILAKEVENSIPFADAAGDESIGTHNVLEVPKGAKLPEYISPPADPAKFIQDERTRIKNEMFTRAAQDTMSEMFNGEGSSGFSQAQSFAKTVPHISSRADTLEDAENTLFALTMEYAGKKWDGKIKYKDRYEITNLNDALTQLRILVKDFQIESETFVKEELKRMIREFDGKLPKELLVKAEKEIDAMDFVEWMKRIVSSRETSPADQQQDKSSGTMAEVAAEAKTDTPTATKKPQGDDS